MLIEFKHKEIKLGYRYLTHVEKSIVEGEISEGDLATIQNQIGNLLELGESTIIYELSFDTLLNRTVYGEDPPKTNGFSKFRSTPWGSGDIAGRRNIFLVAPR